MKRSVSPLQIKALVLLLLMALAPLAGALVWLLPSYGKALRMNEEQMQLAVVNQGIIKVERHVAAPYHDAVAVAAALSQGSTPALAKNPEAALLAVKAVLASRRSLSAVRFEVPTAKVDTVISMEGAERRDVPRSTPELRAKADEQGVGFQLGANSAIVVPIPKPPGVKGEPPKGYVTAPVYLSPLSVDLKSLAEARDVDGPKTGLLVVNAERQIVASYNVESLKIGNDASKLALWTIMPDGNPRTIPIGTKGVFEQDGVKMIGTIHTLRNLGWALAMWRPESQALAGYHEIRSLLWLVGGGVALLAIGVGVFAARTITQPVLDMAIQARRIGRRAWSELQPPQKRKDELGELSRAMTVMATDLQDGEAELERQTKLRGDLSRFMSKELVEGIVAGDHPLELGGRRMKVTVLFADVVAFTPLAEGREPEQIVALLNELFSVMTEVVFRHEGTVDKFIGDCLMAVWGAPLETTEHAARALAAAEDMMRFLEVGAEQWRDKYDCEVRLAVGVNSGEAIVGNVGSDKRMEYTVIGDIVNVAARLENIAAPNQVLVGETTYELAQEEFDMKLLGARKLTGRESETKVYELETS